MRRVVREDLPVMVHLHQYILYHALPRKTGVLFQRIPIYIFLPADVEVNGPKSISPDTGTRML
jgi:hypothetical protein